VWECVTCQQNKSEKTHPVGLPQSLPILEKKWKIISMDFIRGFPKTQGRDCIYVVVNRMTKFSHLFSISLEYKETHVAELFFKEIFKLHGLPKNIVSDRDNQFLSSFW